MAKHVGTTRPGRERAASLDTSALAWRQQGVEGARHCHWHEAPLVAKQGVLRQVLLVFPSIKGCGWAKERRGLYEGGPGCKMYSVQCFSVTRTSPERRCVWVA